MSIKEYYKGVEIKVYPYNYKEQEKNKTFSKSAGPTQQAPQVGDLNNYEFIMSRYENRSMMY